MHKQFLAVVLMFVAMSSSVWADCGELCKSYWWPTATASDVQAELDAGVYNKLSKQDRATAWNLAKNSPLKGSKAYWALNEARFK